MIGIVNAVLPAVTDIVGRFLPEDAEEKAKAERAIKAQLTEHLAKVDLAQIEVNKEEAKGKVASARMPATCLPLRKRSLRSPSSRACSVACPRVRL